MCLGFDFSDSGWRCILTMYFFGQKYFDDLLFASGRFVEAKRRFGTWSFLRRELSPS